MAKSQNKVTRKPAAAKPVASTPVRNTAIPRPAGAKPVVTHEMIARRAYEIAMSGFGGSEFDNWIRAETELRGEVGQ